MDTEAFFEDGEHILYVNGAYRDDSEIGRLMHDFGCTSAAEMHYPLLADRTQYLKENPKGVSEMCKVIEEMRREEREEGRQEGLVEGIRNMVLRMLQSGRYALEEIANISGLPLEEVQKLQEEKDA